MNTRDWGNSVMANPATGLSPDVCSCLLEHMVSHASIHLGGHRQEVIQARRSLGSYSSFRLFRLHLIIIRNIPLHSWYLNSWYLNLIRNIPLHSWYLTLIRNKPRHYWYLTLIRNKPLHYLKLKVIGRLK